MHSSIARFSTIVLAVLCLFGCDSLIEFGPEPGMVTIRVSENHFVEDAQQLEILMTSPAGEEITGHIARADAPVTLEFIDLEPGEWSAEVTAFSVQNEVILEYSRSLYIGEGQAREMDLRENGYQVLFHPGETHSSISFHFGAEDYPEDVDIIYVSLTVDDVDSWTMSLPKEPQVVNPGFQDVPNGNWSLRFSAKGPYDYDRYVFEIELDANNNLPRGLLIELPPLLRISHDFEDGLLPNWGGPAEMTIVDGALFLTAYGSAQWRYEIFDHGNPGLHNAGEIRFDLLIQGNGGYFDFRGHSEANNNSDWGPYLSFRDNQIKVRSSGDPPAILTGVTYELNSWYRFQINFDNTLGEKGTYMLLITELDTGTVHELGPYEYYAQWGKMVDVVQYSFGASTHGASESTIGIDNVQLVCWRAD